jgi:PPK2 family polyphosphate:nucleotide phosphotransferase
MDRHRVRPGSRVRLRDIDPDDTGEYDDKADAERRLAADLRRLEVLQDRLYAENRRALLVVLQAMDAGGKDGTVKHVFSGVNPAGCEVTSFKAPSAEEADHDYLWRIYRAVPRRGNIGIFNRSHYEDVLVVRIRSLEPPHEWKRRYDQINRFEALLVENGTIILKFFLHISKREQKKRLAERLANPDKAWKFDASDLADRAHWSSYQKAYEDALSRCSTDAAPWYVVPANHKWYRNLVVARTIVQTLERMAPRPPQPRLNLSKIVLK